MGVLMLLGVMMLDAWLGEVVDGGMRIEYRFRIDIQQTLRIARGYIT
jgi:hypothetical protein